MIDLHVDAVHFDCACDFNQLESDIPGTYYIIMFTWLFV